MLQETHFPTQYNPKFLHAYYPTFNLANAEYKTKEVILPDHGLQRPRGKNPTSKGNCGGTFILDSILLRPQFRLSSKP